MMDNVLIRDFLVHGRKTTKLTQILKRMNRNQAINLSHFLSSELRWKKNKCDFMKVRSREYACRASKLLKRLKKGLNNHRFEYEMVSGLYLERHIVLCYEHFIQLYVKPAGATYCFGNGYNDVYVNLDNLLILQYIEGDVFEFTGSLVDIKSYLTELKVEVNNN